ncbi:MAG: hypothetical protein PHS07_03070 [Patescibacteria group bacterium]|nr:hypothetical protein [Patescibacteria group bacterium]
MSETYNPQIEEIANKETHEHEPNLAFIREESENLAIAAAFITNECDNEKRNPNLIERKYRQAA